MSIAEKLTYLQTTKQLLKTEINKINNVLDDNSTFRSYPQELFNGYLDILNNGTDTLWSNLEKVSASGEEATLENVETAPIKMVPNGNTSQDTTTGKNILPSVSLEEKTIDGVTFTPVYKNGLLEYININGTKESQQNVGYTIGNVGFENGEEYTISGIIGFTSTTLQLFTNSSEAFPLGYRLRSTNGKETKTAQADERCSVSLYVYYGNTYDNVKVYPMICKNNTNDTYEPYTGGQPSPSPDYPQQVKVVKGENVVSVSGKNLFPINNIDLTLNGIRLYTQDGSFIANGTATLNVYETNSNYKNNISFNLKKGTYTLSLNATVPHQITLRNKTTGDVLARVNGGTILNATFTLEEDAEVYLGFYFAKDVPFDNVEYKIQLELGSIVTPYVPYSKTDYPINLNANMFNPTQIPENNFEKRLSTTGGLYGDVDYFVSDWIPIQPNTEYEVNWTPEAKKRICFYSSFLTSSFISYNDTENIFKTPNNATYMRFSNLTSEASNLSVKLKNSLELCKINTYKDFPFKAINGNEYYDTLTDEQKNALNYGSWYVHKEMGKTILNGSENWKTNRENDNYMRFHARALSNVKVQNTGYSNLFIVQNESSIKNTLSVYPGNDFNVYIWLSKSIADSVANLKTWLSTHNTIVYYILATPTEEEITNTTLIEQLEAISKAKSVKDKTYITQTNEELPFILDVEAIKEYSVE